MVSGLGPDVHSFPDAPCNPVITGREFLRQDFRWSIRRPFRVPLFGVAKGAKNCIISPMNNNLIATVFLTCAYALWPVVAMTMIMWLARPNGPKKPNKALTYSILSYPVLLATLSWVFNGSYFGLPPLMHIGLVSVLVLAGMGRMRLAYIWAGSESGPSDG
jgi:hypothetical protein